jgi:hypothetical protein
MERFNIIRHHLHMYNSVHVSATYTIPSSLLLSPSPASFKALIYTSLSRVLKAHPILNVTIQDEGSREPRWQRVPKINFDQIVKIFDRDPETSLDGWLEEGLRTRVDRVDELVVWRVNVAVKESDLASSPETLKFTLAFFGHHAITDGLSCAAFHSAFLDSLNALISDPSEITEQSIVETPKLPLIHSLEQGAKLPVTFLYALTLIFKTYIYDPHDPLEWAGPLIPSTTPTAPPIVSLRSFSLPPAQVQSLIQKCREEKTTITSLVIMLVARKLGEMYPSHKHFTATIPFSMRKFSGHSNRDMGVIVSNVQPKFSSEDKTPRGFISCAPSSPGSGSRSAKESAKVDEALWNSARAMKAQLVAKTASATNQTVNMLSFVSDYGRLFIQKLGTPREQAFEVTNITTIDGGLEPGKEIDSKKATFDRAWFCGGLSTYGNPYVVSLVSVKGGYMNVCVTWEEGVVSKEDAAAMAAALEEGLRECSGAREM